MKKGNKIKFELSKGKTIALGLLALCLFGVVFISGVFAGTSIMIPENMNISLESEDLQTFSKRMELVSERLETACQNVTYECDCKFDLKEMTAYDIMNELGYDKYLNLKRNNFNIIDTMCKVEDREGVYVREATELVVLELNKPVELYNKTFEIIGANGYDSSIILDIQGSRKTFVEGDCYSDGKITICANELFVVDIPRLDAVGNFVIDEKW